MPRWPLSGPVAVYLGLFIALIFPVAGGIPVLGYLIDIAAFFFVMLFAFSGWNLRLGVATVGSILISSIIFGPSLLLVGLWAKVVVTGTVYGKMLSAGRKPARSFMAATIMLTAIVLAMFWMERELIYSAVEKFQSMVMLALPQGSNLAESDTNMAVWVTQLIALFRRLLPSLVALAGVTQFYIAVTLLYLVFRGAGSFLPHFVDFIFWKMPFFIIYLTGSLIFLRLLGTDIMKTVADNCLLFVGIFYAVFGFSLMEYYLRKIKLSLFMKVIFYMGFVFLQVPGLIFAAVVGLFDSYFDFRHIRAKLIG